MNNSVKILVVLISALGLVWLWLNTPINPTITASTTAESQNIHPQPAQKVRTTTTEQINENEAGTNPTKAECLSQAAFDNDERHHIVAEYFAEHYYVGHVDYINYLTEPELLTLAADGNVRAMYILGLNYRWYAKMDNFQSILVRPKELPAVSYNARSFDIESMKKARYWLQQAALNGKLSALMELSLSYSQQMESVEADHNIQLLQQLRLTSLAYIALHDWLVPQFSRQADGYGIIGLNKEQTKQFDTILSELKHQWTVQRKTLGFEAEVSLNLPPAFAQLDKLKATICNLN